MLDLVDRDTLLLDDEGAVEEGEAGDRAPDLEGGVA